MIRRPSSLNYDILHFSLLPDQLSGKNLKIVTVVVNLSGNNITLNTDLYNPNLRTNVARSKVVSMGPSPVSPMPPGLLNMMEENEIMDLLAYILSGGDTNHKFFSY